MLLQEIDNLIQESLMDSAKEKLQVAGQKVKDFAQEHKKGLIATGIGAAGTALAAKGLHSGAGVLAANLDQHKDAISAVKQHTAAATNKIADKAHAAASAVKKTIDIKGTKVTYNPNDQVKTLNPGFKLTKQQMADAYYGK